MPLLLHEPTLPYESRRLVRLLAQRGADVETRTLWPHRVLPLLARLTKRSTRPDVVHAVGGRALAMAVAAAGAGVVFSPTRFPTPRDVAWLRAVLKCRFVRVVCTSDAERRTWVTGGLPIDACVLIRPGVSLAMPADARAAARARFGYTDSDRVLFTPVPAVGRARATAVWTGCLLNVLDDRTQTLAWSDGGRTGVDRLHALRTRLLTPDALRVHDADDPADALAACDAVLLPPADFVPPTLIAMAMAAGRPVVAHASAQVCEMLEDRHTAVLSGGTSPNALAARCVDLFDDAATARRIADRARAEAYEYFLPSRLLGDYCTLYAAAAKNGGWGSSPLRMAAVAHGGDGPHPT